MQTLNVNVGILGHVDSGKTSLAKALSQIASTACFDKHPDSQERGITLDLGFSAFTAPPSERIAAAGFETVQFTLVDCPGHASLIRTIIGGAQIIDTMILVIDVTKGIQTQTAECIVIGEMLGRRLVVALNKCDQLLAGDDGQAQLEKMKKRLRAIFTTTRWPRVDMVCVAANPGEGKPPIGLDDLTRALVEIIPTTVIEAAKAPVASTPAEDFLMFVDHCFPIKGQGTVLTGTVLRGVVEVNGMIELPAMKEKRKVKSIQMFRRPVDKAKRGDRVGICVTNLPAENIERAIVCSPQSAAIVTATCVIAEVKKIRYFKPQLAAGMKLHITVGHDTVLGSCRFFDGPSGVPFSMTGEYNFIDSLPDESFVKYVDPKELVELPHCEPSPIATTGRTYYAVITLDHSLLIPADSTLIGAKLDSDVDGTSCRLALQGSVVHVLPTPDAFRSITAIRWKNKPITIDRIVDDNSCIAKGLAKGADEDVSRFVGLKVHFQPAGYHPAQPPAPSDGTAAPQVFVGTIEGTFGRTGKVKLRFMQPIFRKSEGGGVQYPNYSIVLHYKKNQFAVHKQILQ